MFKGARKWLLSGLGLLLAVAFAAFLITRDTNGPRLLDKGKRSVAAPAPKLVDQSPLTTANSLARDAVTADEQHIAEEAVRVADQEVDLAFATALRQAQDNTAQANATFKPLRDRIHTLESRLSLLQDQAAKLTKLAASGTNDKAQQQLEVTQARVTLVQDALEDAKQDLARAGGDPQSQIQHELDEHEALQHGQKPSSTGKPSVLPSEANLLAQFRQWHLLRENQKRVLQAQQAAEAAAQRLAAKHEALEKGLPDTLDAADETSDSGEPSSDQQASVLANLHNLSDRTKIMSMYDRRIDAQKQLASLYGQWSEILDGQIRAALHTMLRSLLWILLALIGIVVVEGIVERFFVKVGPDRRRTGTMRMVLRFGSQVIGVLVIALVVFGPPTQLSTILALAGAGLTVALKDFIVAFFGWFVLMGPQGIRRGDWVEIEGIGGEVVEVGPLRTILLETGNWNDAGHPTGRRVSFVNTFAIERHYFNFTTAGQWLWDELDILIPSGEDPYELTTSVLKLVTEETREDAVLAEQEWHKATHDSMVQTFAAAPAINVRPTNLGVNLVVRYVVNAHNRYAVRTRLYEKIVELLHHSRKLAFPEPAATSDSSPTT
jgi:small-conductance mechanosensitive channel